MRYRYGYKTNKMMKIFLFIGLILIAAFTFQGCTGSNNWAVPGAASNLSPTAVITSPLAGSISDEGLNVTFTGAGQDTEDGALSGASLVWTSDIDGLIGTGGTFNSATLTRGSHVITLTATDDSGGQGTAFITITVRTPWLADTSWGYRQQIIISASMAPLDQTDFPALIKITDQTNPLFGRARSDGFDILFTDMDGVNQLDHEIELYRDTGTAELDAWVRIPALSSTEDTIIYMYYGYPGAGNQENPTGVWDSNFTMVQHLQEPSGTHLDSTSNNNDSISIDVTAQGTAAGQINGADEFVRTSQNGIRLPMLRGLIDNFKSEVPNDATDDHGTIEVWMYPTGSPLSNNDVFYLPPVWADNWQVGGVFRGVYPTGGDDRIWLVSGFGASIAVLSTDYNVDEWVYIAWVYTADGVLHGYKNGVEFASAASAAAAAGKLFLGCSAGNLTCAGREYFTGNIDEFRTSDIARSKEWIEASYKNQNDPGTGNPLDPDVYTTFGAEEPF